MPTSPIPSLSGRRERHSAERRLRLVRAALELFAKKGFSQTTVEDITNAADLGKGTFFNYFPSKEHILAEFGRLQIHRVQMAVDEVQTTNLPIQQFFLRLALDVTSEPARNSSLIRALIQANLSSEPVRQTMREIHARATQLLGQIVSVGQLRGEIRPELDPIDVAQSLRQMLLGTMLVWSLYGDGTLEVRIRKVMDIFWSGLACKSSTSTDDANEIPAKDKRKLP